MIPADAEGIIITRSLPHGHVAALGTARQLGLHHLLGDDDERCRDLILALVVGRVLEPSSKLAAARAFRLGEVDEDELYAALDWLLERQRPCRWPVSVSVIFVLIWLASPALLFAVYGIALAHDQWQASRRRPTRGSIGCPLMLGYLTGAAVGLAILATAAHAGEPNKQGLAFRIGAAGPRACNVRSIRAKAAPILTNRIADHSKPSPLDEIDHEEAGETADRLWKDLVQSVNAAAQDQPALGRKNNRTRGFRLREGCGVHDFCGAKDGVAPNGSIGRRDRKAPRSGAGL